MTANHFDFTDASRYFASGTNNAGEVRGLAAHRANVGIVAQRVNASVEAALVDLEGMRIKVFADSGAFSEVEFHADAPPSVVAPLSDSDLEEVAGLYRRLGERLGRWLFVVAFDRVGDQDVTRARMLRWAPFFRELSAMGVNVIAPVQKGRLPMAVFAAELREILGFEPIWGIPSAKDATSLEEIVEFAGGAFSPSSEPRFHLLGLGIHGERYAPAVRAILTFVPGAEVYSDAVAFKRLAGKTNGRDGGPRAYTFARDLIVARVGEPGRDAVKVAAVKQEQTDRTWDAVNEAEVDEAFRAGWFDDELFENVDDHRAARAAIRAAHDSQGAEIRARLPR